MNRKTLANGLIAILSLTIVGLASIFVYKYIAFFHVPNPIFYDNLFMVLELIKPALMIVIASYVIYILLKYKTDMTYTYDFAKILKPLVYMLLIFSLVYIIDMGITVKDYGFYIGMIPLIFSFTKALSVWILATVVSLVHRILLDTIKYKEENELVV